MTITLTPNALWSFPIITATSLVLLSLFKYTSHPKVVSNRSFFGRFVVIMGFGIALYGIGRSIRTIDQNDKAQCSNFWPTLIADSQKIAAKSRDIILIEKLNATDQCDRPPITAQQLETLLEGTPTETQASMRPALLQCLKDHRTSVGYYSFVIMFSLILLVIGGLIAVSA